MVILISPQLSSWAEKYSWRALQRSILCSMDFYVWNLFLLSPNLLSFLARSIRVNLISRPCLFLFAKFSHFLPDLFPQKKATRVKMPFKRFCWNYCIILRNTFLSENKYQMRIASNYGIFPSSAAASGVWVLGEILVAYEMSKLVTRSFFWDGSKSLQYLITFSATRQQPRKQFKPINPQC